METLQKQISDNRAEWKKYDNELARISMNEAIAEQDELKRQFRDVKKKIAGNSKTMSDYRESLRKTEASGGISWNADLNLCVQARILSAREMGV